MVRALFHEAMAKYDALYPAEPMTPERLDEIVETMRRIAREKLQ